MARFLHSLKNSSSSCLFKHTFYSIENSFILVHGRIFMKLTIFKRMIWLFSCLEFYMCRLENCLVYTLWILNKTLYICISIPFKSKNVYFYEINLLLILLYILEYRFLFADKRRWKNMFLIHLCLWLCLKLL